jgi:hypothetical protein
VVAVEKLAETTGRAMDLQVSIHGAMNQLSSARIAESIFGFSETLAKQTEEMHRAADAFSTLHKSIQEMQNSQTTMLSAVAKLEETGLQKTLVSLRESLVTLGPVLSEFRQPFVLQAVPAGGRSSAKIDGERETVGGRG